MRVPDPRAFAARPEPAPDDALAELLRDLLTSGIGENFCPTVSPLVDHLFDRCEGRPDRVAP
jgi:hypothetical protein